MVSASSPQHKASQKKRISAHAFAEREGVPKLDTEGAAAAVAALNEMLSPEQCGPLVEAIINKYITLSAEELQEWQAGL